MTTSRSTTIAVVVVLLIVGCFFGYRWYGEQKFVEAITPHVKNTSLRVANAASYELEKGTKITFKELRQRLDDDVAEIDKRILEVQTLETPAYKVKADPVIGYLKSSQVFLRALNNMHRKVHAFTVTADWAMKLDDLEKRTAAGHEATLSEKATDEAFAETAKAKAELDDAVAGVLNSTKALIDARLQAAGIVPIEVLVAPTVLEQVAIVTEKKGKRQVQTEPVAQALPAKPITIDQMTLAKSKGCLACHDLDRRIVGPAYKEVAQKYKSDSDAPEKLAKKVLGGGKGVWGPIPMPPNQNIVTKEEVDKLVAWILAM